MYCDIIHSSQKKVVIIQMSIKNLIEEEGSERPLKPVSSALLGLIFSTEPEIVPKHF